MLTLMLLLLQVPAAADVTGDTDDPRPNVVLILADDLGHDDVGRNNPLATTPNLDDLAAESARLTRFNVHLKCAPSRASLLTGRHFQRTGVWGVHGGRDFLSVDERLVSEDFADAGYDTAMVGKWHSGLGDGYYPWQRGFDEAHLAYLYRQSGDEGAAVNVNGVTSPIDGFAAEHLTDAAIGFATRERDGPFFLYLAFMAPHSPWRSPAEYQQPYLDAGHSEDLAAYYGMVAFMDTQVGRLLAALDEAGLAQDTVVVFLSDNGPVGAGGHRPPGEGGGNYATTGGDYAKRNPTGLRGGKGQLFENGLRSVFYVRWPGRTVDHDIAQPAVVEDVRPTLLALAGIGRGDGPAVDGVSLAPRLLGEAAEPPARDLFFSEAEPKDTFDPWRPRTVQRYDLTDKAAEPQRFAFDAMNLAVTRGDLKLIHGPDKAVLFDLDADPREKRPVRDDPRIDDLRASAAAWWEDVLAEPASFTRPRLFVDPTPGVPTVLQLRSATRAGGVSFSAHEAFDLDAAGDRVELDVTVAEGAAGPYEVRLLGKSAATGATLGVDVAGQTLTATVDRALTLSHEHPLFGYDPAAALPMGRVTLPAGPATLTVSVVDLGGAKRAADALHHVVLTPVEP